MPWIIGIDEAGYGPNLGPLVMTSVACRVPEETGFDLWQVLSSAVRRPTDAGDDRLLVADSKKVYSTARGLHGLEAGIFATLSLSPLSTLAPLVNHLCPTTAQELSGEVWYTGAMTIPIEINGDELASAAERFRQACEESGVSAGLVRSVIVCPARFNQIVDEWGSKGAVLGHGLGELLRDNLAADDDTEPAHFFIDKHGGRNTYAAMLHNAVPDSFVMAHEEGMERSVYSILGQKREVRLTFQPRADAEHFCVALASMVSKYLREVLMLEFNQFWRSHVPGLKPTAGYPADAARYFQAIWPAAQQLGLTEAALWRKK